MTLRDLGQTKNKWQGTLSELETRNQRSEVAMVMWNKKANKRDCVDGVKKSEKRIRAKFAGRTGAAGTDHTGKKNKLVGYMSEKWGKNRESK